MSDTPRTDERVKLVHSKDSTKRWELRWVSADFARQLERELNACQDQLARICREGFDNQDTIGGEPADDYVLRMLSELRQALSGRTVSCSNCNALAAENEAMREAINESHEQLEHYLHYLRSTDSWTNDCKSAMSKLQPYLK